VYRLFLLQIFTCVIRHLGVVMVLIDDSLGFSDLGWLTPIWVQLPKTSWDGGRNGISGKRNCQRFRCSSV